MASGEINTSVKTRSQSVNFADFNTTTSPQKIPWDGFNSWISCFCVVTFDLELGQVIEKIYPENYVLSDTEKANICYLAFPDSNTGCMGDIQFHFRIRSSVQLNDRSSIRLGKALHKDFSHYFGYVSFRQVKDSSIKRGYFQKSFVLLSRLPYVNLFKYLVKHIASEYFGNGDVALETVCYQIDKWERPYPGRTLQLPVVGFVLQVCIPENKRFGTLKQSIVTNPKPISSSPTDFGSPYQPKVYDCFNSMLPHLHLLWELVLLAEPLVVMAPSPSICSEGVQSLVNLIQPLQFVCDYRPYFTIHDSELKEYTTKTQSPPKVILGVTNPFFAKTLQQWPHIIRIGDMPSLTVLRNGKKSQDLRPGIYTKYKPSLIRDKAFFKRFNRSLNGTRPIEIQNLLLVNYVVELTQSFMIPLERYIGSLMPLQRSISPWKSPPKLRRFNIEEFIQTLPNYGPQLTSNLKGNWQCLYRKFFKSVNFETWFEQKKEEVNFKLELLHLEALSKADINAWLTGKDEVEITDLYMQVQSKCSSKNPHITKEIHENLKTQLIHILSSLPTDMQNILTKSM